MTEPLERVEALLERRFGMSMLDSRRAELRLEMLRVGEGKLDRGCARVITDPATAATVASSIMVGETYLFRGPGHYRALRTLADERAREGGGLAVLCAGCASGEEAWSAAAVLRQAGVAGASVVGWDLSDHRIAQARRGAFSRWSARTGLMGYGRWFSRRSAKLVPTPELAPLVRFETRNLLDPLPTDRRFDVVFFRNVAIYWSRSRGSAVAARLGALLTEGGMLLLGAADPSPADAGPPASGVSTHYVEGGKIVRFANPPSGAIEAGPALPFISRTAEPTPPEPSLPASDLVDSDAERLVEAERLASRGLYDVALRRLDRLEGTEACFLRGVIALAQGDRSAAADFFRRCAYESSDPKYRHWLGIATTQPASAT